MWVCYYCICICLKCALGFTRFFLLWESLFRICYWLWSSQSTIIISFSVKSFPYAYSVILCHYRLNFPRRTLAATTLAPKQWQGGLGISYFLGGPRIHQQQQNNGANESAAMSGNETVRLRVFNEAKLSTIYNVIAAIPGTMESDRWFNYISLQLPGAFSRNMLQQLFPLCKIWYLP